MWADNESVILVAEPTERHIGSKTSQHLLEIPDEKVGDNWRYYRTHSHTANLFVELRSKTEARGHQGMAEMAQNILCRMSTWQTRDLIDQHSAEE
jgi:hypothetical protein